MKPIPLVRIVPAIAATAGLLLASCATSPAPASKPVGETRLTQVISRAPIRYPYELSRKNIIGKVVVEFIVTKTGEVANAKVIEATDSRFGPPALESIYQWKFRPGLKDGRPVASRLRQDIAFNLSDEGSTRPPLDLTKDGPPAVLHRAPLRYPVELNQAGITGRAIVEFTVTTTGDVTDAVVIEATHPLFAEAALECIGQWKYKPAVQNGQAANVRIRQELAFDLSN